MYKIEEYDGEGAKSILVSRRPMGAGVPLDVAQNYTHVEVWGTEFIDPGPERCEFRATTADGKVTVFTVPGY
jgi:hypothetical protein